MPDERSHIVCIASEHKGNDFLEECHHAGWRVTLITREKLLDEPWVWSAISKVKTVRDDAKAEDYIRAITNICGSENVDRLVGLDEFDVLVAAQAREHLQLGGMTYSFALRFRDKLAMRNIAMLAKIPCPEFTPAFNQDAIEDFLSKVEMPVVVKPRHEVSGFGIRKCESAEEVWNVLNTLDQRNNWRDHPSQFLIERFIEGKVFHVDSVVYDGKAVAAGVSEYGIAPLSVTNQGGVFTTQILPYDSKVRSELTSINSALIKGFELERGVTHAEFVQSAKTGEYFLLEIAVRVGGAYIANVLEQAAGFNLWREWAKLEIADPKHPYQAPEPRSDYAGLALALAKIDHPDTSHYADPEIVYRVSKPKHVGLIFRSGEKKRIDELLEKYAARISEDFLAIAPTREHYDD